MRQLLRLQGEGCSRAAPTADAEASEGGSPVHRVSFAISMDISTLSGISSNVEITPIPDTLPAAAHAEQECAENDREDPNSVEDTCGPIDTEQAAANDYLAAATESTAGHAHDTRSGTSQRDSAEVEEGPTGYKQSVCSAQQDVSTDPSNSEQDSALAMLPQVQSEAFTGSTAAVEDGISGPDEERSSEAGRPSEMQATTEPCMHALYFPELLGQLGKLAQHAPQVVD